LFDQTEEFTYRSRVVHLSIIPDKYSLLEEVENDSVTSNVRNIPLPLSEGGDEEMYDEDLLQRAKNKTLKDYLAKRWRGKKAKRVRKVRKYFLFRACKIILLILVRDRQLLYSKSHDTGKCRTEKNSNLFE